MSAAASDRSNAPAGRLTRLRLLIAALVGLVAPRLVAALLADADYDQECRRNDQLRSAPGWLQASAKAETRQRVEQRLLYLRARLSASFILMGSAVGAASVVLVVFRPDVTTVIARYLAGASIFCFAWATLGRLGWAGQSWKGDTVVERCDEFIFRCLYWVGTFLGTLALA